MFRWVKMALWAAGLAALVALETEPVSNRAQLVLGLGALGLMATIRKLGLGGVWRHIFLVLGSGLVLRYFFWRTVNTLPRSTISSISSPACCSISPRSTARSCSRSAFS